MRLLSAFKLFLKAWRQSKQTHPVNTSKPDSSHLIFLSMLQKTGRLVDFLQEDISQFSDAQIGCAVRKVHAECRQSLEKYVSLKPILTGEEGSYVTIPSGYDSAQIKVIGKVMGAPPYKGILRHRGWQAQKLFLPQVEANASIVCPAEVEIT